MTSSNTESRVLGEADKPSLLVDASSSVEVESLSIVCWSIEILVLIGIPGISFSAIAFSNAIGLNQPGISSAGGFLGTSSSSQHKAHDTEKAHWIFLFHSSQSTRNEYQP